VNGVGPSAASQGNGRLASSGFFRHQEIVASAACAARWTPTRLVREAIETPDMHPKSASRHQEGVASVAIVARWTPTRPTRGVVESVLVERKPAPT